DRVVWIEEGRIREDGEPASVIAHYSEFLNRRTLRQQDADDEQDVAETREAVGAKQAEAGTAMAPAGSTHTELPRILNISVKVDGVPGRSHFVKSEQSTL